MAETVDQGKTATVKFTASKAGTYRVVLPASLHPQGGRARRELSETVGEEPGPVYQASKVSRAAAWLVLGCAAGVSVAGIMGSGSDATPAVLLCGLFGLMALGGPPAGGAGRP